jgi:transcriptional regulator with XRE-family HTH domain
VHLRDGPGFTPANLLALRRQLNETQRDFGERFGVSRQTVANWEDSLRKPHPSQLKVFANLVTRITSMADGPITVRKTDLLTVAESAAYLHIAENTIRNAIKDARFACVRDKIPGPWPKDGRYQLARADLDAFKMKGYDPHFMKSPGTREPRRGTRGSSSCVSRA